MALAEAEPTNARGQTLEGNALARHLDPPMQRRIVGKQLHDRIVGGLDVRGIARERDPAERPATSAELRADVRGHETRERERIGEAVVERALADVVAVVKDLRAHVHEVDHQAHMLRHRGAGELLILRGILSAKRVGVFARHVGGVVALERIVRAGLVGERVGHDVARLQSSQQIDDVADPSDGNRLTLRLQRQRAIDRRVETVS